MGTIFRPYLPRIVIVIKALWNSSNRKISELQFNVTANVPWTATKNESWINITGGTSGTNDGVVTYSVSTNPGAARSGTITVSGGGLTRTFLMHQAAVNSLEISPSSRLHSIEEAGGQTIAVSANVPWSSAASESWIEITSGTEGENNGTVTYRVLPNSTGVARSGTITISGGGIERIFSLIQENRLDITPSERTHDSAAANSQMIAVIASVPWTAVSSQPWISITGGASVTNSGTVVYDLLANTTGVARIGSITLAGGGITRTFIVNQAAISRLDLTPTSRSHAETASEGQAFSVAANVPWTATKTAPWIGITSGASGEDNGTVVYSLQANSTGVARSGTITVAGGGLTRTFTVNQAAAVISIELTPSSRIHANTAASGEWRLDKHILGCFSI